MLTGEILKHDMDPNAISAELLTLLANFWENIFANSGIYLGKLEEPLFQNTKSADLCNHLEKTLPVKVLEKFLTTSWTVISFFSTRTCLFFCRKEIPSTDFSSSATLYRYENFHRCTAFRYNTFLYKSLISNRYSDSFLHLYTARCNTLENFQNPAISRLSLLSSWTLFIT